MVIGRVYMPHNNNLTIISVCLQQTQGDASAAFKLIEGLIESNKKQNPKINITWVLAVESTSKDNPFYTSYIASAKELGVTVIYTDKEMSDPNIESMIPESDFFVYFPYVSDIPKEIVAKLEETGKLVLNIGEYNYDKIKGALKTGLGLDRLGVFVDAGIDLEKHTFTSCKDTVLERLGLMNAGTTTVTPQNIKAYQEEHLMFFGYFNKEFDQCRNPHVNPENFITICLHLAKLKNAKNVDLVVRFGDDPSEYIESIIPSLSDSYSSIEIISRDGKSSTQTLSNDKSLPKVRIIDPFPLDRDSFKLLQSIADPFMALTGDQSFSEGINRGAIIFYQMMIWKCDLADAYQKLCSEITSPTSELSIFNKLVFSTMQDKSKLLDPSDCQKIAEFIYANQNNLIAQMEQVKHEVGEHHNLLKNLIDLIRGEISAENRVSGTPSRWNHMMYQGGGFKSSRPDPANVNKKLTTMIPPISVPPPAPPEKPSLLRRLRKRFL